MNIFSSTEEKQIIFGKFFFLFCRKKLNIFTQVVRFFLLLLFLQHILILSEPSLGWFYSIEFLFLFLFLFFYFFIIIWAHCWCHQHLAFGCTQHKPTRKILLVFNFNEILQTDVLTEKLLMNMMTPEESFSVVYQIVGSHIILQPNINRVMW